MKRNTGETWIRDGQARLIEAQGLAERQLAPAKKRAQESGLLAAITSLQAFLGGTVHSSVHRCNF